MTDHLSELAKYLKILKDESGFTLDELAAELKKVGASTGASKQYLSMLMKGNIKDPSPKVLADLAAALSALSEKFDMGAYWRRVGGLRETAEIIATSHGAYNALVEAAQRKGFEHLLHEHGLSAETIEEVLARLDRETIARVVQGEEPLDVRLTGATPEEIAAHLSQGYDVLAMEPRGTSSLGTETWEVAGNLKAPRKASALDYLKAAHDDFRVRNSGQQSMKSRRQYFEAGRARIEVRGTITKEQDFALTAIATAIEQLLGNKPVKEKSDE